MTTHNSKALAVEIVGCIIYGEHRFTIPVEWEYKGVNGDGWGEANSLWHQPSNKRVTKLRCPCGKETTR